MKNLIIVIIINLLMVGCQKDKVGSKEQNHDHSKGQSEKTEKPQKKTLSPHTETMLMIGDAHIHIDYSSPGVRGRITVSYTHLRAHETVVRIAYAV